MLRTSTLIPRAPRRRPPLRSSARREVARLRRHFREVLAELRGRDMAHLSAAQRSARARLIGELERYALRGRFPRNLDFPGRRTPYFVDASGTRCAMAHLIESTGAAALVARVAATLNNAFVRELEGDLELQAWLDRTGLTAAEAARIQPSYCFVTKAEACVCTQQGEALDAVIEATVIGPSQGGHALARVDVVHGDMSLVAPGDQFDSYVDAPAGSMLIAGVTGSGAMPSYYPILRVNGDLVEPDCQLDVPEVKKADVIQALLSNDCSGALAAKDPIWGESQCDQEGDAGGCSWAVPPEGVASSALPGALVFAAAVMARRRWSRGRRVRARRPWG